MHIKKLQTGKLYILLLSFLTISLTACDSSSLSPEETTPKAYPEETTASSPDEATLVDIMQKACGSDLQTYLYLDMNHDGQKELLGAFVSDNDGCYQTWYASSDGSACKEVLRSDMGFDECAMEIIELDQETHIAINTYNWAGTSKFHSILALHNSEIVCLDENQYGYVGMDDNKRTVLVIEGYDGMYDPDIQMHMMHTWKRTYLTYDKTQKTYKEYTAKQISEEEFLKLKNAKECLETIRAEHTKENTKEIQFSFFIRKNGILHVQCNEYDTAGFIYYSYYTMQYQGDTILDAPGEQNEGQMSESFSQFEAVE